jgi:hypothetical protein
MAQRRTIRIVPSRRAPLRVTLGVTHAAVAEEVRVTALNPFEKMLDYLDELERRNIYYTLSKHRDAIMANIALPGWLWEVEFFADGRVEVEIFRTQGGVIAGELAEQEFARLLREDDEAERALGRKLPWDG